MANMPHANRYRNGARITQCTAQPRPRARSTSAPAPQPGHATVIKLALALIVGLAAFTCLLIGPRWLGSIGLGITALLFAWAMD